MSNVDLFVSVGLTQKRAEETAKNKHLSELFAKVITDIKCLLKVDTIPKQKGNLLYVLASKLKSDKFVETILQYIASEDLKSELQVTAACEYSVNFPSLPVDVQAFKEYTGIGVTVTKSDVQNAIDKVFEKHKSELIAQRYSFPLGKLISEIRSEKRIKWGDGQTVKLMVDEALVKLLGPKTDGDKMQSKKTVTKDVENEVKLENSEEPVNMFTTVSFHEVGDNYKTDNYVITDETMQRLEEHKKRINGKVVTRFPPEPNGILHIGHAKALNINFGYAAQHGGYCYLRYDDTNPEKEEEKYFTGILDMVRWLGFTPYKVTHASDYFDTLYEYAIRLIRKGLAYVCHQKFEEVKGKNVPLSPWRDRPIEESLALFQDMREGKIDEGAATLRCKYTMEDGKTDPVAYRIKFCAHHRTGDKWCIYPTYDFTHPLCDSIEDITHSMCTKEFQSHRSMYYWLCNNVGVYCPVQWEYGRLNLTYTIVSKRKILKLTQLNLVNDWDDPRLFTLTALRRRGIPPEAINNFIHLLGITMQQVTIDPELLEHCARQVLNKTAVRVMAVLDPLPIRITNFSKEFPSTLTVKDFPALDNSPTHLVNFSSTVYLDRSDFDEGTEPGYRRLTPNQAVGLKYTGKAIKVVNVHRDSANIVQSIDAEIFTVTDDNKPKAFIHWVSKGIQCTFNIYNYLFKHKHPEDKTLVPDGFISDVSPDSLEVKHGFVDCSVKDARPFKQFQFERVGFFCVDKDSTEDNLIFNRTVSLREDSGKKK